MLNCSTKAQVVLGLLVTIAHGIWICSRGRGFCFTRTTTFMNHGFRACETGKKSEATSWPDHKLVEETQPRMHANQREDEPRMDADSRRGRQKYGELM